MLTGRRLPITEDQPLPPDDDRPLSCGQAVDELYRREQPRLLRFLRRTVPHDQSADLVQRAFVRFLRLGSRQGAIAEPDAYLRRTAAHLSIDDARLAQRRSYAAHVPLDHVDLQAPDPLAALEARDMLMRLEQALFRLKPRTREIFLAHRIDGYSYIEIAGRTGLSVKGVEKHMSKAIAHIDRLLGDR